MSEDEDAPGFNREAVRALPTVVGDTSDEGDADDEDGELPAFDYR